MKNRTAAIRRAEDDPSSSTPHTKTIGDSSVHYRGNRGMLPRSLEEAGLAVAQACGDVTRAVQHGARVQVA